jgi:hypothetical protein
MPIFFGLDGCLGLITADRNGPHEICGLRVSVHPRPEIRAWLEAMVRGRRLEVYVFGNGTTEYCRRAAALLAPMIPSERVFGLLPTDGSLPHPRTTSYENPPFSDVLVDAAPFNHRKNALPPAVLAKLTATGIPLANFISVPPMITPLAAVPESSLDAARERLAGFCPEIRWLPITVSGSPAAEPPRPSTPAPTTTHASPILS